MYCTDVRKLALNVYSQLCSLRKTSKLLGISHSSIHRWLSCIDRKQYRRKKPKTSVVVDVIKAAITANPFISIRQLQRVMMETMYLDVSTELLRIAIHRMGFSRKKARHTCRPSHLPVKTSEFLRLRDTYQDQRRKFVAIDETSFGRNGLFTVGWSKRGERLYVERKMTSLQTMSACVCVDVHGLVGKRMVKGAFNTSRFIDFLQSLPLEHGTVVIMDNVSFHHSNDVLTCLQERGCMPLFTPPYSPWFNPIELCFSIVKRAYYQSTCIDAAFETLTGEHCRKFFEMTMRLRDRV